MAEDEDVWYLKYEHKMGEWAEEIMDWLQLVVAFILVLLFGIGVFDLGLKLFQAVVSGSIYQPMTIIQLLETVLLLFLVVEVFRTAIAHVEDKKVLPLVIDVAIIGIVRSIITYRVETYSSMMDALLGAVSYSVVLLVLIGSFFIIHRQERKSADPHPS